MDGRAEQTKTAAHAGDATTLGDYLVGARVARGRVSDVYDARHAHTGEPYLVYVLRPGAMRDQALVHRVVFETDAARWLRHPASAKVGACAETPSRRLYVAVARPAGRTLGELIAEGGPIPPGRLVRLASRLVEALDEAHAVGLVHGRLTPAAVLLADASQDPLRPGDEPHVTLTGLGTAAAALDGEVAAGDRAYVSPEQLAGREPDVRSDVFGLASLLHHALVGAPPEEPASAGAGAGGAGASTAGVLAAARAADPARRPATVKALWEEFLAALIADVHPAAAAPGASVPAPAGTGAGAAAGGPTVDFETLALELLPLEPAAAEEPAPAAASVPVLFGAQLAFAGPGAPVPAAAAPGAVAVAPEPASRAGAPLPPPPARPERRAAPPPPLPRPAAPPRATLPPPLPRPSLRRRLGRWAGAAALVAVGALGVVGAVAWGSVRGSARIEAAPLPTAALPAEPQGDALSRLVDSLAAHSPWLVGPGRSMSSDAAGRLADSVRAADVQFPAPPSIELPVVDIPTIELPQHPAFPPPAALR